ncbi:ABC transporter ATP-binding protein [Pontibacter indicus]|uniref:Lipopolysaccharide transport system ATP-binding protein n=1 Tax=Pontibacter indicus TaxID=1317125 RepID=A0A1R3XPB9_9BACT|nr:ABC transporter ATP-binding protein [Pontibacter indicus]SIT93717.1 lipopolysaccharide transport system ATP-binding protein [Pontibacter indicus]
MTAKTIQVENISKLYRLGTIGTGSFRQDLQQWWNHYILRKKDPFFQLDRCTSINGGQDQIWALRDISFDVMQGESLGIIGSNGSGKSTLLKIISRIVKPTSGTIKGRGTVSSLLEVGTGFNKELTGRENIYISGYILGMSKPEVTAKFDEIVAFSGIEEFIETPVKRYSSGMYVRLAFAVAAHLEPDILIVDEVLAVGDADFQKKCLGKMKEVSQSEGRTILFVSHNMQAINTLCDRAIWLDKGVMKEIGPSSVVINKYIASMQKFQLKQQWPTISEAPGNDHIRFEYVELVPHTEYSDGIIDVRTPLTVKFRFWNLSDDVNIRVSLVLFSYSGDCIFDLLSPATHCQKGIVEGECNITGNFLNDGSYYISLHIARDVSIQLYYFEECLSFDVEDYRGGINYFDKWWGVVRPNFPFLLKQKEVAIQ